MKASPKKSRQTTASPKKSPRKASAAEHAEVDQLLDEVKNLQFTVGDRDVEIERMKTTLIALNHKLAALQDIQKEVEDHKTFLRTSEDERGGQQEHIVQMSHKVTINSETHVTKHEELLSTIEQLQQQIRNLQAAMQEQESQQLRDVDQLKQDQHQVLSKKDEDAKNSEQVNNQKVKELEKRYLDQIKREQDDSTDKLRNRDRQHQDELRRMDKDKAKREQEYLSKTKQVQEMHESKTMEMQEMHESKTKQMQEMHEQELRKFRQDQESKDQEHRDQVDQQRREAEQALKELQSKHDKDNRDFVGKHTQEIKDRIANQEQGERNLNLEKEEQRRQMLEEIARLTEQIKNITSDYSSRIDQMTITIETHLKTILQKDSQILSLDQQLDQKKDIERQLGECKNREQGNQGGRDNLRVELENGTDYILELEEKVYKANKTSLELLKQLKDAEIEIETLKQYIVDLKQRIAVYIPVKEDQVDRKLAEFINNYPERSKLKIMFMRESEGVYQFGTKRVAVKVEKDNIKIRVGGGYLSIDEFLDQYTPVELEKLERKDPIKRFSEKIAVQKTIVNQGARETSPVRSPVRSSPGGSPSRKSQRRPQEV